MKPGIFYPMMADDRLSIVEAWHKLFSLSSGSTWIKIPEDIRRILGLDNRLGILNGVICTKHTAEGINQFISKLNSIGE